MPETTVGQHTPGPWTFPLLGLRGPDGRAIDTGDNDEPASSNRRLIAAAPELLQACQDLVGTAHATTARCGFGRKFTPKNNPCDCSQHAAYDAARAAIAKATGGAL